MRPVPLHDPHVAAQEIPGVRSGKLDEPLQAEVELVVAGHPDIVAYRFEHGRADGAARRDSQERPLAGVAAIDDQRAFRSRLGAQAVDLGGDAEPAARRRIVAGAVHRRMQVGSLENAHVDRLGEEPQSAQEPQNREAQSPTH